MGTVHKTTVRRVPRHPTPCGGRNCNHMTCCVVSYDEINQKHQIRYQWVSFDIWYSNSKESYVPCKS